MNAHELAQLLLTCPNWPVRFMDYEGHEMQITGLVDDPSHELADKPVVELNIELAL